MKKGQLLPARGTDLPPNNRHTPKLPCKVAGCQGREQDRGKVGNRHLRGLPGRGTSAASLQSWTTPCSNWWVLGKLGDPLHSPKTDLCSKHRQQPLPTSAHPSPLPQSPGHGWPSPVQGCNRLLERVCRRSGRVSSSPGKRLDTHGQGGRAGPLCYSAHGTRWREAAPCSGRNAWGEIGHGVRWGASTPTLHPHTRPRKPLPPHTTGSSLAVHITPKHQPEDGGAAPGDIGRGGTPPHHAPLGCNIQPPQS